MTLYTGAPHATGVDERPLFSADECERIRSLADRAGRWTSAGIYRGTADHDESPAAIDLDDRSTRSVALPDDGTGWPLSALVAGLVAVNDERYRFDLWSIPPDDGPSVLRYEADSADHFRPHRDVGPFAPTRKLTFTVQLSEPSHYRGGDLVFPDRGATASTAVGTLVTFPSFEYHLVTPVVAGVRHALVGWVHGPTFS